MVGEGVCRRAYWQAQVQCSIASDLSAPLTLQRGDHSDTHPAKAVAKPAEKMCCFAERILEPTLDECDPNNTHSVAWIDRPTSRARGKKNSTFFKNMGYRGQSCDDWITLMRYSFD